MRKLILDTFAWIVTAIAAIACFATIAYMVMTFGTYESYLKDMCSDTAKIEYHGEYAARYCRK